MSRRGADIFFEVLESEGVKHLFGNPGTTELPLMAGLVGRDVPEYVLALQEASVIGMADGYAQVTGRPSIVNLHTSAGVGNAVGNLTNAVAHGTPMLVTAGQQDRRHLFDEPLLSGNLTALAGPVSKSATEVRTVDELGPLLRRAFAAAAAPPTGPVFLSIPMDIFDEETDLAAPARSDINLRAVANRLDDLADFLTHPAPGRVAIVVADEAASGADPIRRLAETLGAAVFGAALHSSNVFPSSHPLYRGALRPHGASIRSALSEFDRVLILGGHALLVYPYSGVDPLPDDIGFAQVSASPDQLGRFRRTHLGLLGDPGATAEALVPLLADRVDPEKVRALIDAGAQRVREQTAARHAAADAVEDRTPLAPIAAARALLRGAPDDIPLVNEAVTTSGHVLDFHRATMARRHFFCRGGGLGWGMPAATGVALGLGGEPTLCVVGDGSAMYSPQAMWTAARLDLPVVFAVVNNQRYLILENNLALRGDQPDGDGRFPGMNLDRPSVDYRSLATSMGVAATLAATADEVTEVTRHALASGRPHLIEIPIGTPAP